MSQEDFLLDKLTGDAPQLLSDRSLIISISYLTSSTRCIGIFSGPSNVPTDPTPEQVSEIAVVNEGPSEGINALTVFGRAPSSLCPRESPGGFEPPPRRGSLSHLAYGLSTLMGHPISGGSVSAELSAPTSQPSSLSVFSPLISQSSRVLSGVVSSLFSPWSNANTSLLASPRPIAEEEEDARSEESLAEDRPCEDSLINAFERIAVTDGNSEADGRSLPHRERETSSGRVTPSRLAVPQVELHSTFMEDAQCDFTHTETSSHYSDAVSALSSSQASRTPTGHSFVSQVRVQGVALEPPVLGEDGTPTVRCSVSTCIDVSGDLADVKKSPAANLDATELPETSNSLNRESASMGVHVPLSQSVQQSNMVTQVQGRAILQSANRPRIPMSPVPLMVSMHHDDDNWNRSLCSSSRASGSLRLSRRGSRTPISPALVADPPENDSEGERSSSRMSSGRFSGPLNPRRISKNSGTDGKSQSRLEIIPQAQEIVAMESEGSVKPSKRRETVTLEQPSPHLLQSLKHSTSSIVDIDTANTGVQSSEDSQPIDDKEQSTDDKENVSPEKNASTTVARRRGTHRLPMLSVQALEPVPPPRKSNQGSKENSGLNNDQSVIEEKARLRQEVATLRAKEDTLRMVLSKYAATLEEAGDAQGRLCFATGQACAQAAQEKAEARRSAASLQGAVGDSHRRHLRYRAEIERARASQEELLQTIEALKACYAKRAFKGQNYEKYCREKIQRAIEEQEATKSSLELEVSKVRVQAKQLEMRQSSLEAELKQKAQENQELLRICDSLLTGVQ